VYRLAIQRGEGVPIRYTQTPIYAVVAPSLRTESAELAASIVFPQYLGVAHAPVLPIQTLVLWVLVALGLLDIFVRPPRVEHVSLLLHGARLLVRLGSSLPKGARLELARDGDGPVAAEALAHVDHALFAFGVAFLQLLALGGQRVLEGWAQTFAGRVSVDHDAVAILEAECQRSA
jgi:hypothetical protein